MDIAQTIADATSDLISCEFRKRSHSSWGICCATTLKPVRKPAQHPIPISCNR